MLTEPPLLEREAPLAAIQGLLSALAREVRFEGRNVLLSGEAGVGKTSLLRHLRRHAGAGLRWWWGGCEPLLAPPPLAPFIDFVDQLPLTLAPLVRRGEPMAQVMAGLLDALRDHRHPTVLVIEDVHWADGATLDLLRYLGRRIDSARALLVLTYRDDEVTADHPLMGVLGTLPTALTRRLALQPLSAAAVAGWSRQVGRDPEGVFSATGGNPFFVSELLAGDGAELPRSVRHAVLARAGRLGPGPRALLDLLCVVPGRLELALLQRLLPQTEVDLPACLAAGLLQQTAAAVGFRHELARQALEQSLAPQQAQHLHGLILKGLSQEVVDGRSVTAARQLHHARQAVQPEAVLSLATQAAAEAARAFDHRQAASLFAMAQSHAHGQALSVRASLAERHAHECMLSNQIEAAIAAYKQALALRAQAGDGVGQGINHRQLARLVWLRGGAGFALDHARQSVALLTDQSAERELAMAHATMAQLLQAADDPDAALVWGRSGLALAEPLGDAEALAFTLNSAACAELRIQDSAPAWAQLQRSLDLSLTHGLDEHAARAYINLPTLASLHRRLEDAVRWADEGLSFCAARDLDIYTGRLRLRRLQALLEAGRWAEVRADLAVLLAFPAITALEREQAQHMAMLLALRQGEAQARPYWDAMCRGERHLSISPLHAPLAVLCAEAAWLADDHATVARVASAALPGAIGRRAPWFVGQLACWLQRVGHPVPSLSMALPEPCARELAGHAKDAALAWAAKGCPHEQALAMLAGAPAQWPAAVALLDSLGAEGAARVARRRLRSPAAGRAARGPYRHARNDPLGLTAREREVLRGLVNGLSNAQMATAFKRSTRTVENHVATLLAKLGAKDRQDAVRIASAHPPI